MRSPWALPAVLLVMPAIFFAILYGPARSDLAAARAAGWVQKQVCWLAFVVNIIFLTFFPVLEVALSEGG